MFTDGSRYFSKLPLNYIGKSGISNKCCIFTPIIASHIAKILNVDSAEFCLGQAHNGNRILSKNFLNENEEIVTFTYDTYTISEYLTKMEQNLKQEGYLQEEIENAKFEFLKQEFVAKLIGLKDQKTENSPLVKSKDEDGNKHIKMAPMLDFDYSFHIGEERDDMLIRKCDNGKTDIGSFILEFKDYPGFEEFVKNSLDKLNMEQVYSNIFESTGITYFTQYEGDVEMMKFMEYVNENIKTAKKTVSEIYKNENNNKRQIIIDNDGGTDDFVAIVYAFLSKKFDVKGITLVAGNTDVNNVKQNVFKALEMAGVTPEEAKKIGIYLPENVNENIISDGAQGDNGLGGVRFEYAKGYETNPETAEEILARTINENPGQISIVATGPLTNIANVLEKNPDFVSNVDELVIMGGDEGGGNITPYAEFNIYQDPEAAKKVFEAGFKKITMIGFNITKQMTLCPEVEEFLKQNGSDGNFIYDITRATADLDRWKNKVDGASMNDILTLLYLLEEDKMFETKQSDVDVDITQDQTRGRTNILEHKEGKTACNIVTAADGTKILREMLTTLFPGKEVEIEEALDGRELRIESRDYILANLPEKADTIRSLWNREGAEKVMARMVEIIESKKQEKAKREETEGPEGH